MQVTVLTTFAPLLLITQIHCAANAPRISKSEVMDSIKRLIADVEDPYNYAWTTVNNELSSFEIYCDMGKIRTKITEDLKTHLNTLNQIKQTSSGHGANKCFVGQEQNLLQLQKSGRVQVALCTPQQVCEIGHEFFDLTRDVLRNNLRTIQDLRVTLRNCAEDDDTCISQVADALPSLANYPEKLSSIGTSLRFAESLVERVQIGCQDKVYENLGHAAFGILQQVKQCADSIVNQ